MTEKEVQDVARLARAFDDADSGVMKMSHALAIARALLHVLAERDEARKNLLTACELARDFRDGYTEAERNSVGLLERLEVLASGKAGA